MRSRGRAAKTTERRTSDGASLLVATLLLAACAVGCGGGKAPEVPEVPASLASTAPGPVYRYDSLDARPVTSEAMRGRVAVLLFVTTDNLASQAQVNYVATMARRDGDRVAYAVVAMEGRESRELVEIYRTKLELPCPVALADEETMSGGGPFGMFDGVPTTLVLDAEGRVAWRHSGIVKPETIRDAMAMAARSRP